MENNNGRGIFYGVIGVATLVVAIIGATFAYFSATVTQANAITGVNSTTVNLTYTAHTANNLRTNMIPVDTWIVTPTDSNGDKVIDDKDTPTESANTAFYRYPGLDAEAGKKGAGTCRDNVGNDICSVYQFTISNPSTTTSQRITGELTVTVNGNGTKKFENLHYAVFKGAASSITSYNVNDTAWKGADFESETKPAGTLVYAGVVGDAATTDKWTKINDLLGTTSSDNSETYTVVIWLEEIDADQNAEQGLPFAASITFRSPQGSEVSGVITAS